MQEAWAYRGGLAVPVVRLYARFETWLVRTFRLAAWREPLWAALARWAVFVFGLLCGLMPVRRHHLYDPKPKLRNALRRAGLAWFADGVDAFRASSPAIAWPPLLMDSGLLVAASRSPDAFGFEAYCRVGSSEAVAQKGLIWARFGSLGVVGTHMTFEYADGGVQRRKQRDQLAARAAALVDAGCRSVLVLGDLNHALPSQTTGGSAGHPPAGFSPTRFRRPWLPKEARTDSLLDAFERFGLSAARLSGDTPTNVDGTIDHVFAVRRAGEAQNYAAVKTSTSRDDDARISDHLLISVRAETSVVAAAAG